MAYQPRQMRPQDLSLPEDMTAKILSQLGSGLMSAYDHGRKRRDEAMQQDALLQQTQIPSLADMYSSNNGGFTVPPQNVGTMAQPQEKPLATFAQIQGDKPNGSLRDMVAGYEAKAGLPQGYLTRTAEIESGFNPNAKNPNSSATGLFQFIDPTRKAYGNFDARDPVASTDAAARLAKDNGRILSGALGREPNAAELYYAHQQGAGNAVKALRADPNARAVDVLGRKQALLNGADEKTTIGQHIAKFSSKFDGGNQQASIPAQGAVETQFAPQQGQPSQRVSEADIAMRQAEFLMKKAQEEQNPYLAKAAQEKRKEAIALKQKETYGFQVVGDQLVRTDPRTGAAEAIMSKPANALDTQYKQAQIDKLNAEASGKLRPVNKNEGTIPAGYQAIRDANGDITEVRAIKGSSAEADAVQRQKAEAQQKINANVSYGNLTEALNSATGLANADSWYNPTVGKGGALNATRNPLTTKASDLDATLQTIKARTAFSELESMRKASPTGAALGNISDTEGRLLQNSVASVEQSQSKEQFLKNMGILQDNLDIVVHGKILNLQERAGLKQQTRSGQQGQAQQNMQQGQTATNPKTGQKIQFDGAKWVPVQ